MSKTIFINMENQIFRGNLLDVGLENQGIVYNIYKEFNDDVNIEYINGKEEEKNIKENYYHNCILLFSLNKLWFNFKKKNFIEDIYRYLKEDGLLHIWDIDKGYSKIFNGYVKILVPGGEIKKIRIMDFNILKNNSKQNTLKLLDKYFKILDLKNSDGLYYIKAQKKREV
ncbi:class I SAM-dependent methyltransferase [Clostridium sp. WILCCON 0269]|uniref:Class I SAM-dependent methyltransferase n=1 Tax=Candidatus Clostridium eludens TaxID=3381663 RepID=A0ABW8SKP0_9CLOT